ncbi:prostatic acid phosphatase isoform X1 [Neodiprion lecontei]|uniref:acid phosphatase n=2 Tax=Neodiprion lecontei TaxID=441921 RepID=A0A6J0B6R5_NEOLC|nr:prostatic acid phosphatase isoform X1 [Neodiprion lecontei]XP_046594276.1 prostatic acid phosphatase isoform X1 [Neodiprion lecontei]XP_046594277.1 prostatic acid phosphatase isoform X1 [Neodiprion lecontei]
MAPFSRLTCRMFAFEAFVAITSTSLIIFTTSPSSCVNPELGIVIFANVLFRHGDRTPITSYPTDPWGNESFWPVPFGELTNIGKHQHLMLGRWLRQNYFYLLPRHYSPHDIYVQSTDVDRTLMSAQATLAGLYPPGGDQVWGELEWMPIPVHTMPVCDDILLTCRNYCPKYEKELRNVMNSPEVRKIDDDNKELYDYLRKNTGYLVQSVNDVATIYDTLHIQVLYNRTLPEWTKSVYPDKLKAVAEVSYTIPTRNKILQRLYSGRLLGEMVDHLVKKANNTLTPNRKLWIYSAHDTTVANFLTTLNVFEPHVPPYSATVLVELRIKAVDNFVVTVSYKNSSAEPIQLKLPNCGVACPLDKFVKLTKDVIPKNWAKECLLDSTDYKN